MNMIKSYGIVIVLFAVLLGFACVYTIHEGQHGILLRLGQIVLDSSTQKPAVKAPGLHFKFPFINTARIFDTRIQTLDIESSRIITARKKSVLVDYYIKWRINNLPRYYKSTGGSSVLAETLLEQSLNNGLRAEFGKRTISEVVSGKKDRDDETESSVKSGRKEIMGLLRKQSNETSQKNLGIEIIDVRIKRIDLPTEVSSAVYDRMRAERERVATEHRAEGKSKGEAIRADADAKVTVILAQAQSDSKRIRGVGDAMAAKIYANAFSKDSEFYAFIRSLRAYKKAFSSNKDIVVLKPDSQFFTYFNKASARGRNKKNS